MAAQTGSPSVEHRALKHCKQSNLTRHKKPLLTLCIKSGFFFSPAKGKICIPYQTSSKTMLHPKGSGSLPHWIPVMVSYSF